MLKSTTGRLENIPGEPSSSLKLVILVIRVQIATYFT